MKKQFLVCSLLVLILVLCACDPYYGTGKYPSDRGALWKCEEIDWTIQFIYNGSGQFRDTRSVLFWNGEEIPVLVAFQVSYFRVDKDVPDEAVLTFDDKLLSGTWDYRKGKLVFTITDDCIFDGAFDELTFVMCEE